MIDAAERLSGLGEPRPAVSRRERDPEPGPEGLPPVEERDPRPARLPDTVQKPVRARLNYDPLKSEVFIEILNPRTGDVLRRLPAERAADEDAALRDGGAILNRIA